MFSTSQGNSWYSPSKGQVDDGLLSPLVHTMINHFNTGNKAQGLPFFKVTMQPDEKVTRVFSCPTFCNFS